MHPFNSALRATIFTALAALAIPVIPLAAQEANLPITSTDVTAAIVGGAQVNRAASDAPELILYHGTILTGEGLSERNPKIVSAMAIGAGAVMATGSDAEIKRLARPHTRLRDLNGTFLMPGLNDAHVHLGSAGQTKLNVDLTGSKSLEEMLRRIKAKADQSPAGHWLTGGGWDHTLWADKILPTRRDLDKVTNDHPALLERIDGHIAVANTAALAAANITSATPDPFGAKIDHDASGNPTGILREDPALNLVLTKIPPPSTEDRRAALDIAITDALSHGVTSTQDFSEWPDFLVLEDMERTGQLHLRISEWLAFLLPLDTLKQYRASHPADDPHRSPQRPLRRRLRQLWNPPLRPGQT